MKAGRELDVKIGDEFFDMEFWYGDPTGYRIEENDLRNNSRKSDGIFHTQYRGSLRIQTIPSLWMQAFRCSLRMRFRW